MPGLFSSRRRPQPPAAAVAQGLVQVGVVRNDVRRPRPDGWQAVDSTIEVAARYVDGLAGLDGFSHVFVLTWLHLAAAEPRDLLAIHPGGDAALPLAGVFALRVAGRPNPIGLSAVRLL